MRLKEKRTTGEGDGKVKVERAGAVQLGFKPGCAHMLYPAAKMIGGSSHVMKNSSSKRSSSTIVLDLYRGEVWCGRPIEKKRGTG